MATRTDVWTTHSDSGDARLIASPWDWPTAQSWSGVPRTREESERLARALGWLGVGLGMAQLVMPRRVVRAVGVRDHFGSRTLLRMLGMRAIASGAGILTAAHPASWVWARLAGDALDLALLRKAIGTSDASRWRVALTAAAVSAITAAD